MTDSHPIRLEADQRRVRVRAGQSIVADSRAVLTLHEAAYPGVAYFPRGDVDMTKLSRSPHKTTCPYKGEASYFNIETPGGVLANAAWTYEHPKPAASEIAGCVAFDLKQIDPVEISES
jgi:uncharacterized protein (DUF427 family)